MKFLVPPGVERARRTARHRVRDQVHGDLRQGQHQRRGSFLHPRQGHQGLNRFMLDFCNDVPLTYNLKMKSFCSVADPDPGSVAICDPWIRDRFFPKTDLSDSGIPTHILRA